MNDDEQEQYHLALRTQLAERRALWFILQEIVGKSALSAADPHEVFRDLSETIINRLDLKDDDAIAKNLGLPLATVKEAVARFFSELADRHERGKL